MNLPQSRNNPLTGPQNKCKFCNPENARLWIETDKAVVMFERALISFKIISLAPKSHVASIFDLPPDELLELWKLAKRVRQEIKDKYPNFCTYFIIEDHIPDLKEDLHAHISLFSYPDGENSGPTPYDLME